MPFYPKSVTNRVEEVDFLRGIAIVFMVTFHWYVLYDLRHGTSTLDQIHDMFADTMASYKAKLHHEAAGAAAKHAGASTHPKPPLAKQGHDEL